MLGVLRVVLPTMIEIYYIKAFLSIVLITHGSTLIFGDIFFASKHRSFRYDTNLSIFFKCSKNCIH